MIRTTKSVYTCEMPWGDAGVAVQFTAVLDKPQRHKAVLDARAAFLMLNRAGKIADIRVYMRRDEPEETKTTWLCGAAAGRKFKLSIASSLYQLKIRTILWSATLFWFILPGNQPIPD
jgi:hypothetical protein